MTLRLGLISDTHGLLRPRVLEALAGVDRIIHAGDIGEPDILVELAAIAPVTAVVGNTDGWEIAHRVSAVATVELERVKVVVLHGHQFFTPTPERLAAEYPSAGLIVFGHTHRPEVQRVGSVLVVNPGSAGPRRFDLPVSMGFATVDGGEVEIELVELRDL